MFQKLKTTWLRLKPKVELEQPDVRLIYNGGYVPDIGIVKESDFKSWLVYKHPDGQWVTLADLRVHVDLIADEIFDVAARAAEPDFEKPKSIRRQPVKCGRWIGRTEAAEAVKELKGMRVR